MLIIFFLSIYMVIDRDQIMSFLFRLVPPAYADDARLLQVSVGKSFGGFLRGQGTMGGIYFLVAFVTSTILGLPLAILTSVVAGVLMAIPFFGPFVAWAPPVVVALFFVPGALIPAIILMGIGWFVVMNVLQPRLMQGAVGIHPIVVLGSVLIGLRMAGIPGAIFGIPIAAVLSAFFFQLLERGAGDRSVAGRATKRVAEREGRPGPKATRTRARQRRRHRRRRAILGRTDAAGGSGARSGVTTDGRDERPADRMDMSRERARSERRDLDKERGEPLAGGAARGGPRALRTYARPLDEWSSRPKILITNDDGVESRGLLALEAGARSDRRLHGHRARHEPERGRPHEDPHATAAGPRARCSPTARRPTRWTARRPTR